MNITLYTTDCPKCKVLEAKLQQKGVNYDRVFGEAEIINLGFLSSPLLQVDDNIMEFMTAIKYVNSL